MGKGEWKEGEMGKGEWEEGRQRDTAASYLNLYSLGDVEDEVNIGVVVVVGSSWNWNEVVRQLDVLCICLGEEGRRGGGERRSEEREEGRGRKIF